MLRKLVSFFLCLALGTVAVRADIVINEIVHAASDRIVQWDANAMPRIGTGAPWYAGAYNDAHWQSGAGPFGFGTTNPVAPAFGTNVQTRMQNLTPTLYLRKTFTVSATDAGRPDALELVANYNDGFIVYVNGVEITRRWAGPLKQIQYHDMPAQDPDLTDQNGDTTLRNETLNLGGANLRLVEGQNVIAIHALNISALSSNFLFSGTLRIGGAAPVILVNPTDQWKYFPGVVEPSGGVYDPTLLTSGRLNVPWGKTAYVDTSWSQGAGPIGQGVGGMGTSVTGVVGVTPSLYIRKVFTATAAQAADPAALRLEVDYDDSFVAYINGVEVARANLQTPNSFVPRDAVSSGTRNFGSLTTLIIDPANQVLVEGANVIAIQVHNVSVGDADIAIKADLKTGASVSLVANNTTWKYKIGTEEPVVDLDGAIEDNPDSPESVNDWVELYNNGPSAVSLNGWTLTDDSKEPAKWSFPNVSIAAGSYLVVICDGLDITAPVFGGFLHTNFKLNDGGEYLGLRDSNGTLVQQFNPQLPPGSPFHSFGRNATNSLVFFDLATPGAPNAGNEFTGRAAAPTFNIPGGFYATTQSVQLSTATPNATIRYTLNGSEPTATAGILYSGPVSIVSQGSNNGVAMRARTFAPGMVPSEVRTNSYLVGVSAPQNTLPVVSLVGDEPQSLYRPFGVMAIKNNVAGAAGNFPTGPWSALGDPAQYNNANYRGRFMERPVNWQMLYPGNAPGFSMDIGVRMAGSPFTRPRYVLGPQNRDVGPNPGVWAANSSDKPSMNFYMRNDLGGDPLDFPVIPLSPVRKHSDFRFRAGHNDMNPFIIDELVRRSNVAAGQIGSLGINASLYINGVYKGIFNLCQHVREEFLQEAFGSDLDWDVVQVAVPSDGDMIDFQEMFTFLRNNPQNVLANYQGMQQRLDMVNFVDYLITNVYGCTGDWPHNNWIAGRERSTTAQWRFFTWDAEGAFGSFGLTVTSNNFVSSPPMNPTGGTQSALVSTNPQGEGLANAARILYTLLRASPEFKLLFADRIQKHFFNNGAFTDAAITARKQVLRNECSAFISNFNETRINEWISGKGNTTRYTVTRNTPTPPTLPTITATTNLPSRRTVLLDGFTNDDTGGYIPVGPVQAYFVAEGLWPATKAPVFSQHGGSIGAGFNLTITNPNGAGLIYYTVNGTDPRQAGGAINGTLYTGPVAINQTTTVKSRILNGGVWSPMTEAIFISTVVPPLLITEIMYHPPDFTPAGGGNPIQGDEYEFIEIKNTGSAALDLFGLRFEGIDYNFAAGASIPANGFVVLAKNPARFADKYPGIPVIGGYGPGSSLNNAGETITLLDAANNEVVSVMYSDDPPWPQAADGDGYSLVPMQPNSNPDPDSSTNWRLSGSVNGSPGMDDPAPGIPQIQITELLANSAAPAVDSIELFNPGTTDADIGGWFLSDDLGTPKKYRIPDGTMVPAGGYLVLNETQFNTGPNAFGFSQNGDEAVLSSAGPTGNLTGLMEFVSFSASEPGVSFGRYTNSQNKRFFVAQRAQTFGAVNAGPLIPDVVLTEVHYFPSGGAAEFIEIRNHGNAPVALFDPANPANTWRLGGIDYALPQGITLQPRQFLIVAATAPATFRASYSVSSGVSVVGPFNPPGELMNTGERVTLQKPGVPYEENAQTVVPYIDVDFVTYGTSSPWPSTAAGSGRSLERANLFSFGDDPISWKASSSNGGNAGRFSPATFASWQTQWFSGLPPALSTPLVDADGDGLVNYLEYFMGLNPRVADATGAVTAGTIQHDASGPYLTISFRRSQALSGVTSTVEAASVISTWLGGQTVALVPVVNNGDGTETFTHRDTVPINSTTSRFLRVKATGP